MSGRLVKEWNTALPVEPADGYGSCGCGERWIGEHVAHCPECHLTFAATSWFALHRPWGVEQCMTAGELREVGLTTNANGHWVRSLSLMQLRGWQ